LAVIAQIEFNSATRQNFTCNTARYNDNTLSAGSLRSTIGELLIAKEKRYIIIREITSEYELNEIKITSLLSRMLIFYANQM